MIRFREAEAGSITVQTAAIILSCCVLAAAALSFLASTTKSLERVKREAERSTVRTALLEAIGAAMDAIEADASPDSDSPFDPAYSLSSFEGAELSIQDASSALNPNWLRKGILEDSSLSYLLKPGVSPSDLQQYREDSGLSQEAAHYADFFDEGVSEKFLSPFSYACIGASDEFALRRLCLDATGDGQAAERIFSAAQAQLSAGKALGEAGLRSLLGVDYEALKALVTAQPQMNVNFLPERILKAIVCYSAWAIPDASSKWQSIALTRDSSAVSEQTLRDILKLKPGHPISAYLGTRTWFWRVRVKGGGTALEAVVARRLPFDPAEPGKKLTLARLKEIDE